MLKPLALHFSSLVNSAIFDVKERESRDRGSPFTEHNDLNLNTQTQ